MKEIPLWFPKALAGAMVKDYFNSLTKEQQNEVEAHLETNNNPPAWFLDGLTKLGLKLKEKQITCQHQNQSSQKPTLP